MSRNPTESKTFFIRLGLSQSVLKAEDIDIILKLMAYEILHALYPVSHWPRVYTYGISDCVNVGAVVHCSHFTLLTVFSC